jgi:predicted small secreted protein
MTMLTRSLPLLAMLLLAACNTVEGAGEDLSEAGATIAQEARAAQ